MKNPKTKRMDLSLFQKTWIKIRHGMVFQVIKNRFARIGFEIVPYIFFREGVGRINEPEIKGDISDYSFAFLGTADMKVIAESDTGYHENDYLTFLAAGNLCVGVRLGDQIAAYMWINLKECKFKESIMPLELDEAYLWNMYTMESFRGMNLAPYLRYKSYEVLKEMGRDKLYSISEYFNTPAIKFKLKLKASRLRLGLYIKLFKKYHWDLTLRSY